MKLYEKYVVPSLLNFSCGLKPIRYQRKKVVHLAEGEILEVGIGSGLNLPYYEASRVKKIWGLDPSEELHDMAKKVASGLDLNVEFLLSGAEEIPLLDGSVDTALIKISGGCNMNRDIPNLIESAGFSISQMETMYLPSTPKILGYNFWGSAQV